MKSARTFLLTIVMLAGVPLAWTGCIVPVGGDVTYGGGGPWFHDDVWVDGGGRGWYGGHGGGAYVHPGGSWGRH